MPPAIDRLTLDQFIELLRSAAALTRRIDAVHLHHTWRPRRSEFRGLATIEAMRRCHVELGWNDIAQHLTIDPQGGLWTGRNWNAPPASQKGRNGDGAKGPFMIELIGDFDSGADLFEDPQRDTTIRAISGILSQFRLPSSVVRFHSELGPGKTCPGSAIDRKALLEEIEARQVEPARRKAVARKSPAAKAKTRSPFGPERVLGYDVLLPYHGPIEDRSVPENMLAADGIEGLARSISLSRTPAVFAKSVTRDVDEWADLRPHVINLTKGRLSDGGSFRMKPGALEGIIGGIADYAASQAQPRVVLHAHGGLVGENSALLYARAAQRWWMAQNIYPVFFVWETSAFEVLRQRFGIRGLGDARDRLFEEFARKAGGKWAWGEIKESALLSSSPDTGDGYPGGAYLFAQLLRTAAAVPSSGKRVELNAVGHSAGAIFHAHFLPLLTNQGVVIDSLSILAPAIRNDLFSQNLLPVATAGSIRRILMCTMNEEAERDDDLVEVLGGTVYGKSLLYLISRAFEAKRKTPILGLEETLREDAELWRFFTGGGARLELSTARGEPPNPNTRARSHGCFDNDPLTMNTVATVITAGGPPPARPFPRDEKCEEGSRAARMLVTAPGPAGFALWDPSSADRGPAAGGRRIALCAGIDDYPAMPLSGCVSDAESWSAELRRQRFAVSTLLNGQATREGILTALSGMIDRAAAGDVLVFQYSGHGTQVADLNGDERDRFDEAFVPVDYGSGALLLDDDLAEVYSRLPKGALLTLFMDCCHSGTNSRFRPIETRAPAPEVRRRYLPMTPALEEAHRRFRGGLRGGPPAPLTSLEGVVHFAACQDNQYAYEQEGSGNFTRVAVPALRAAISTRETNETYLLRVAQDVLTFGHPQTPKLMKLPSALTGRPVLAPLAGASTAAPGGGVPSRSDLLYHLEAAMRLAQDV